MDTKDWGTYLVSREGVSIEQSKDGLIFTSRKNIKYHIQTKSPEVISLLNLLHLEGIRQPLELQLFGRNLLLYKYLERELFRNKMLELSFVISNEKIASLISSENIYSRVEQDLAFTNLRLHQGVTLTRVGSRYSLVNPETKSIAIMNKKGFDLFGNMLCGLSHSNVERSFARFLWAQKFIDEGGADESAHQSESWSWHDKNFHFLSRRPISTCKDIGDQSSDLKSIQNKDFGVGDCKVINNEVLASLRNRRSRRDVCRDRILSLSELKSFFGFLLEQRVEPDGTVVHNFPAAGGIYNFEYFCVVHRCLDIDTGIYHVLRDHADGSAKFAAIDCSDERVVASLQEASNAWGMPGLYPDVIVFIGIDNTAAASKYLDRAYRLALLNGGVLMHVMYMLSEALCLSGCALGTGSDILEGIIKSCCSKHVILAEFCLSASRANLLVNTRDGSGL